MERDVDQIAERGSGGGRVPSIENIYPDLLCGSLDCGNFTVRDGFPEVVIVDLSLIAFANEQTRLGLQGVDMLFQL